MKKVIEKYYCDICKVEIPQKTLKKETLPFYCTQDQTEGRSTNPYIIFEEVEICPLCLDKATVLKWGWRNFEGWR